MHQLCTLLYELGGDGSENFLTITIIVCDFTAHCFPNLQCAFSLLCDSLHNPLLLLLFKETESLRLGNTLAYVLS